MLEREKGRQQTLLNAREKTEERKKKLQNEYEDNLISSPTTSPKIEPTKAKSSTLYIKGRSSKQINEPAVSNSYTLPGQVEGMLVISDHEVESQPVNYSPKPIADSNNSLCSQSLLVEPSSYYGSSQADLVLFDDSESVDEQVICDLECDLQEQPIIDDEEYIEAVQELQVAVSSKLLDRAVSMHKEISESIVNKVSSLGPEAIQVLEEIKSKLSLRVASSGNICTNEESQRSPTPFPKSISANTSVEQQPFSVCSSFVRKDNQSRPSVDPSLHSIKEGFILSDVNNRLFQLEKCCLRR